VPSNSNSKGKGRFLPIGPMAAGDNPATEAARERRRSQREPANSARLISKCASTLDIVSTWQLARQLDCFLEVTYERSPIVPCKNADDMVVCLFATTVKTVVTSGVGAREVVADVSSMRYLFIDEDELIATSGPGVTVKALLAASADLGLEPVGLSDISDDLSRLLFFGGDYASAFLPSRSIRDAQVVKPDGTVTLVEPKADLFFKTAASRHIADLGVISRLSVQLGPATKKNFGVVFLELPGSPNLFLDALEQTAKFLPAISVFVRIIKHAGRASLIAVSILWPDSEPGGAGIFARIAKSGRLLATQLSSGATYDFVSAHHRLLRDLVLLKFEKSVLDKLEQSVFVRPLEIAIAGIRASLDVDQQDTFSRNHTPIRGIASPEVDLMWSIRS
jgi:hypothetical protein